MKNNKIRKIQRQRVNEPGKGDLIIGGIIGVCSWAVLIVVGYLVIYKL